MNFQDEIFQRVRLQLKNLGINPSAELSDLYLDILSRNYLYRQ